MMTGCLKTQEETKNFSQIRSCSWHLSRWIGAVDVALVAHELMTRAIGEANPGKPSANARQTDHQSYLSISLLSKPQSDSFSIGPRAHQDRQVRLNAATFNAAPFTDCPESRVECDDHIPLRNRNDEEVSEPHIW